MDDVILWGESGLRDVISDGLWYRNGSPALYLLTNDEINVTKVCSTTAPSPYGVKSSQWNKNESRDGLSKNVLLEFLPILPKFCWF